jgi:hypothetical protein
MTSVHPFTGGETNQDRSRQRASASDQGDAGIGREERALRMRAVLLLRIAIQRFGSWKGSGRLRTAVTRPRGS